MPDVKRIMPEQRNLIDDWSGLPVFRVELPAGPEDLALLCGLITELRLCHLHVAAVLIQDGSVARKPQNAESRRIFLAGADVVLPGEEQLYFSHRQAGTERLRLYLTGLAREYDIVLVIGMTEIELPVIRLHEDGSAVIQRNATGSVRVLESRTGLAACAREIVELLGRILRQVPIWACVLIGGRSSRMGQAKHLLQDSMGVTWLEKTVAVLDPFAGRIVLSGGGLVPASLQHLTRLPDIPGIAGPLTGILSAMRWQPAVSWLLVACDMPCLSPGALQWLVSGRRPGCWAIMPKRSQESHVEPLLAHYDPRCHSIFEEIPTFGSQRIGDAARNEKVATPTIPPEFLSAWNNINTPEELHSPALTGSPTTLA